MRKWICCLVLLLVLSGSLATASAAEAGKDKQASGEELVSTALKYKGVPYKFGGTSPKGFDCSGFVWYVFDKHSKSLPRTADRQYETGKPVASKQLQPGDVVFFSTTEPGASHCGIYAGGGKFVHASSSRGVMVSQLADSYWKVRYIGARRI